MMRYLDPGGGFFRLQRFLLVRYKSNGIRSAMPIRQLSTSLVSEKINPRGTRPHKFSKKQSTKLKQDNLIGLRLIDLVNLKELDINMKKTVQGNRKIAKFDINELGFVKDDFAVSDGIHGPNILETITVLAIILESYYQTGILSNIVSRSFRRLDSLFKFDDEVVNYKRVKTQHSKGELEYDNSKETSFIHKALKENGYEMEDLYAWIKCIKSKSFQKSLQSMQISTSSNSFRKWPTFLALFTLRRTCITRLEAHEALRLFQLVLPTIDREWQFGLFIRTLRILHEWHIEFVPTLCEIFIRHSHPFHQTPLCYNQMLWLVSKFGTKWSEDNSLILSEALGMIVKHMSIHKISIDTKGYLAIAYITSAGPKNDRASAIVDLIKRHEYEYSKEELIALEKWENMKRIMALNRKKDRVIYEENDNDNENENDNDNENDNEPELDLELEHENDNKDNKHKNIAASSPISNTIGIFPYIHGIHAMEMLISQDSYEALRKFDNIPATSRIPMLWAMLLTKFRDLGELTPEMTDILWTRIQKENVSLNPYLIKRVCEGYQDTTKSLRVIGVASTKSKRLENALLRTGTISTLLKVKHLRDLNTIRYFLSNFRLRPLGLYETLLEGEARFDRKKMWRTYTAMREEGYDPKASTLLHLCTAASDLNVRWGDLYAVQRAVVEFKQWVRGAAKDGSDKEDILKIYPTPVLFHRYIIMIGRANYDQELLEVLPWMERIQFQPTKLCLCALIVHSPNGSHLFAHGLKVGGEWPTEFELEQYIQNSKQK